MPKPMKAVLTNPEKHCKTNGIGDGLLDLTLKAQTKQKSGESDFIKLRSCPTARDMIRRQKQGTFADCSPDKGLMFRTM